MSNLFKSVKKPFGVLFFFFKIGFFTISTLNAKGNFQDSLHHQLEITAIDTSKINLCLKLNKIYRDNSPDSSFTYLQKAYLLAEKSSSYKHLAETSVQLGKYYLYKGLYAEATRYFISSLEIYEEIGDVYGVANVNNQLGLVYWKEGNLKEGLNRQLRALKLSERLGDKKSMSTIYNGIGLIYWDQGLNDKALEFYHKSIDIKEVIEDKRGLSLNYNNIGLIYREQGNRDKALSYYLKSLKTGEEINYKYGIALASCNAGRLHSELGDYEKSDFYYNYSLRVARDIQNLECLGVIFIYRATSCIIQGEFEKSIEYSLEGLKLTKKINAKSFEKMAYENLSIANDSLRNYEEALKYYELFKRVNDGIFNEANSRQIVEMQTKYESNKRESENELLRRDIELQQLAIKRETSVLNFLFVITGLILLMVALLIFKIRDARRNEITLQNKVKARSYELEKAKEKAEGNDRLKSAFLTNVNYEARMPMNGIMSFVELLKHHQLTGEKQREYIEKIEKSGERMLTIMNNLVDISKIDSGQMEIALNKVNINYELELLLNKYRQKAKDKGVDLQFLRDSGVSELFIRTDKAKFCAVMTNLIKNALKFTEKGSIFFGYNVVGERVEFFVRDTGVGIKEEVMERIFKKFLQADGSDEQRSSGTGLGLAISRAYAELMGGEIWVKSFYSEGSTFYFSLPFNIPIPSSKIVKPNFKRTA